MNHKMCSIITWDWTTCPPCVIQSYGYGAAKGEAERISIWDAQYTKGEFQVRLFCCPTIPYTSRKLEVEALNK